MKAKSAKPSQKAVKPAVQVKDIRPKKDVKGGAPEIRYRTFSIVDRTQ
jgi:hypothetical protein